MDTKITKTHITIALIAMFATIVAIMFSYSNFAKASAPSGLPATMATSSTIVVGTSSITTLFADNLMCSSRVISTVAQPIMLSFGAMSSTTPSGTIGHYQAASTTVAYDSGIYGCGLVSAYGFNASTTITKSEFN